MVGYSNNETMKPFNYLAMQSMNITELARKLKVPTKELRQKLPELGFDIGMRAIKIDDRVAQKVIEMWSRITKEQKDKKTEKQKDIKTEEQEEKPIAIPSFITVHDFAEKLNLSVVRVISELLKNGVTANINERIDYEIATIVAEDLGFKVEKEEKEAEDEKKAREKIEELIKKDKTKFSLRPPIVVVMGHVDHGKTTILDAIREANVASTETGGITQHIGAYQINLKSQISNLRGKEITFIDTPGHEAFKSMRIRGGEVADIAVLVVAADDGVQPQTVESIKIIQEEKLPFLVAINKIDKPEADIDKVKKGLAEINLTPEDWGGKTICVLVSAKSKQGLDNLLEMILLLAEMEKDRLLSNPNQEAVGTVVEAHLDKGEGPVATILIQAGTLKPKDLVIVGGHYGGVEGKIKMLKDFQGQIVKEAKPGMPVRVLGLKKTPKVGDILQSLKSIKDLKKKIKKSKIIIPESKAQIISSEEEKKALNIIIRTDVLGSQEAICQALEKIKHPEVGINIIKKGLGNILEADVLQVETVAREGENVQLIGFYVTANPQVMLLAKEKNVEIKFYKIIYELIEDIKKFLTDLLEPERIKIDLGEIEVIALFKKGSGYQIVGAKVKKDRVIKESLVEVWRKKEKTAQAKITQLQIEKKVVDEAREGKEVGLKVESRGIDIQIGDRLKVYREEERKRTLAS